MFARQLAESDNEVPAFLLTLGAGLATTIGAALAFVIDPENKLIFAACLSIAAGVMTYVSFIEIYFKCHDEYVAFELEEADATLAATFTFFGGLVLSISFEVLFDYIFERRQKKAEDLSSKGSEAGVVPHTTLSDENGGANAAVEDRDKTSKLKEKVSMLQMAAFSGIAIALHNLPEGIATFVAAVEDPEFGASMAIAIGIHNIPEGLAVAIPVLKATNSKCKAFAWAFLSGVAEPVGAILAWIFLREVIGPLTYALLFGVIGGVMIHISIKKLVPTALKYDPDNRITSYAFFVGMFIMASSLVAFEY
jgi:ZIP family zinc transporter|mmetsp:Transcript_37643/g.59516  ORF Transcript_37643/g.59516 Transcript_37643/m.59516 type:complete len:308 (+) Transcript_37643:48-971(+)